MQTPNEHLENAGQSRSNLQFDFGSIRSPKTILIKSYSYSNSNKNVAPVSYSY